MDIGKIIQVIFDYSRGAAELDFNCEKGKHCWGRWLAMNRSQYIRDLFQYRFCTNCGFMEKRTIDFKQQERKVFGGYSQ